MTSLLGMPLVYELFLFRIYSIQYNALSARRDHVTFKLGALLHVCKVAICRVHSLQKVQRD